MYVWLIRIPPGKSKYSELPAPPSIANALNMEESSSVERGFDKYFDEKPLMRMIR